MANSKRKKGTRFGFPVYLRLMIESVGERKIAAKPAIVRVEEFRSDEMVLVSALRFPVGDRIVYGLGGLFTDQRLEDCGVINESSRQENGVYCYRLKFRHDTCTPIELLRFFNLELTGQNPEFREASRHYLFLGHRLRSFAASSPDMII